MIHEVTDAKVEFGLIPKDHWQQPSWINETRAAAARQEMVNDKVIYGGTY
jgi:alpha 1,2-mannosyltransferase